MHENRETSSLAASNTGSPAGEGESRTTGTHGGEESDGVVVPVSPPNKATESQAKAAEGEEGRTPTEENTRPGRTPPAQDGRGVSQGLAGVRQAARERKRERFTTLLHHLTADLLRASFYALKKSAAPGVDGVRWREYEDAPGRAAGRSERPDSPGSVPGTGLAPDLHTEDGWAAAPHRHRGPGGQDRSTGRGDHLE